MKTKPHHILKSAVFSILILLFFGLIQTVSGQTTITLTTADNGNTVTIPANATNVIVEVWGAGGGGAGGDKSGKNNVAGGGGGGGEYSRSINISPGTYSFQVGAGGPGGPDAGNGSQGGNTSFDGGTVLANGGGGGIHNGAGGSGGTGGVGNDANVAGTNGSAIAGTVGGDGGAGANGGAGGAGSSQGGGTNGSIPGGGGGGASGNGQIGGTGADGQIVITYTISVNDCPESTVIELISGTQTTCQNDTAPLLQANITTTGGSGTPTLEYQWYYNTTNSNTITGATAVSINQSYSPPTTTVGDRWYFCVGYATDNTCGQTASDESLASPTFQVTVNAQPTTANAGPEQNITVTTATLNGNTPSVGTGIWTKISGSGTITNDADPGTTVTGLSNGSSVFRWTISNAPCPDSWSEVTINVSVVVCNITLNGLDNITCNDNGTSSDPGDDTFTFTLNPDGTNLGGTYSMFDGTDTFPNKNYSIDELFGPYPISGGNLSITITDVSTDCSFGPFTVTAPDPCSVPCSLTSAGLDVICDDNGTHQNSADDTFTFTLNPVGVGLSATYTISGDVSSTESYGSESATFGPYPSSGGAKIITITDGGDESCQIINLQVNSSGSCSHDYTECSSCHITHSSLGMTLTSVAGNALLCQSCHTSGLDAGTKPLVDANKASEADGEKNSHAWDVLAVNSTYQTNTPTDSRMSTRLPDGNIICSTCHNQHNNGSAGSPYLRVDNTGDAMCKDCHSVRDVQRFQDGATNKGSHPVGVIYDGGLPQLEASPTLQVPNGKVECSSCHGVHDVTNSGSLTTDGNLLRMTNDVNLCKDCHNYPTHNGMDCLDCHEVHNTVDGTIGNNLFMIKDKIIVTTPAPASASINADVVFTSETGVNSFVDKNGTYNGICEVCHTDTSKHTNVGGVILHEDATDKREQNCVGCHFHNVGFETPSGPQTCVSCHASATTGGRGGTVQIVGTGGEMDNSLASRHTASGIGVAPDNAECEACHFDSGITHPTSEMMLRDPDDTAVWSGDVDVYCVKCHDGDAPTTPADFSYINTSIYNKASYIGSPHDNSANSCLGCHETHGSQYPALTMQATNYENCFACHDGGVASTTISEADIAIPGISGTGHAFSTASSPISASSGLYESNAPSDPVMTARLDSGNIICSTCHDSHDNTNGNLLVSINSGDEMCKDCHTARDVGRFTDDIVNNKGSHPVGLTYVAGGDYVDPAPILSKTQYGLKNGKIECSSCHDAHNATSTDGNLLRESMTNAACKECHNYQPHRGFDCLDCHQSHNTTNIMLVPSTVNGSTVVFNSQGTDATPAQLAAKSFADGDGTRDGICEVCHTTTAHHTGNVDDGHGHYDGQKCTSCHAHNDPVESFPNGSCHECHLTPTYAYPNTGAHAAHVEPPYNYACSICHYGLDDTSPGHANGTADVIFEPNSIAFRNGLDAITPTWDYNGSDPATKTCSNVYCHSNGMSADRGTDQNDPALGFGPDNDHDWGGSNTPVLPPEGNPNYLQTYHVAPRWDTGTIPMCVGCHPGRGKKTAPYDISPGDGWEVQSGANGTDESQPPSGQHGPIKTAHHGNSNIGGWAAVQCFWCHDVDTRTGEGGIKKQGTYGTSYHIDGWVRFKVGFVGDGQGGTFVQEIGGNRGRGEVGGHCNNQSCWD